MDGERIQISAEESGERIDALLARAFPALSRSLIQRCMEAGAVTVNGRAVKKNARAAAGGLLLFSFPETAELPIEAQELSPALQLSRDSGAAHRGAGAAA